MKKLLLGCLLLVVLSAVWLSGCGGGNDFDSRLNTLAAPHRFSIAGWEWRTLTDLDLRWLTGGGVKEKEEEEVWLVKDYFAVAGEIKNLKAEQIMSNSPALEADLRRLKEKQDARADSVERIIKKQIQDMLAAEGIFNPFIDKSISFPPLIFKLQEMPALLVVSPREKIESLREIVLVQDMTPQEKEALEAAVDGLGVSSLVENLGGLATYPSLVDSGSGLAAAIETAVHEWIHQYLAFTPLGFRYVLDETGIAKNYDIATMNESLAGMVGKEIGGAVYRKYYADSSSAAQKNGNGLDFNAAMREIRKTVDVQLARGEVKEAEEYMERRRRELAVAGYRIRKLNQAYFAFHGAYADAPAFENQIGRDLKALRAKRVSLKEFLKTAAGITSLQELAESAR